ncbi:MAG: hypothetical protein AAFZ65_09785, partial [Planctomycetota bacterium]
MTRARGFKWGALAALALGGLPTGGAAQELTRLEGPVTLEGIVSLEGIVIEVVAPRRFVVDLGTEDGVEVGDPARLERAEVKAITGRVVLVGDGSATIQLTGLPGRPELGMAVAVEVPRARAGLDGEGDAPQPIPVLGVEHAVPAPVVEQAPEPVLVEGQISEVLGGRQVRIDLGSRDDLQARDLVDLGDGLQGRVVSVEDESAVLFVLGPRAKAQVGTPARFEVPIDRLTPEPVGLHAPPPAAAESAPQAPSASADGELESSAAAPEGAGTGFLIPLAEAPVQEPIDSAATVLVEGRILRIVDPRRVTIDRGAIDGLALDDEVLLIPRIGAPARGRVSAVGDRSADVDLPRAVVEPELGMRVEVEVPERRLARTPTEPSRQAPF